MAKLVSMIKPKRGVVYECYRGYIDQYGDRARRGQKFVLKHSDGYGTFVLAKASGRGVNIVVRDNKFAAHFCPAATPEKVDVAPQAAETPFGVEAHLIGGTWDDVKEHLDDMPEFIKALLKRAKPELFEAPKTDAFEFDARNNTFSTAHGTPFFVGKGLVEKEDALKCLVVDRGYKAELFEGPGGRQCIRFIEE